MRWHMGILALLAMMGMVRIAAGDDEKDVLLEQKKALATVQKMLQLPPTGVIETKSLMVVSDLTVDKLRPMGPVLEKAYQMAVNVLAFEPEEKTWEGKIAIYVFSDRDKYETFVEKYEKRGLKNRDESASSQISGTSPHVAVTVARGEGSGSLELRGGFELCGLLMRTKTSVSETPRWVTEGFGRAVMTRANPARYASERAAMKKVARARAMSTLWAENQPEDTYLLGASFMDFMAFGTEKGMLAEFVGGYISGENDAPPDMKAAIEATGMMPEQAEAAWKRFAATSK
ncbi:hypothetical protein [Tuwongella immobilis]|nr:hypothetical protein [Tuwongella immobilis]